MALAKNRNERGMVLLVVLLVVALLVTILVEFAFSTLVDLRLAETYRDTTRAHYLAKGGITVGRTILKEDGNGYDGLDELWAQGIEGYPVADGSVSIRIEDHGGRLDLNMLIHQSEGSNFRLRYERLLDHLGAENPAELTDTLIDWIDADHNPEDFGAENTHYRSLEQAYECKNGKLDTIDELTLVKGYGRELVNKLRPHVTAHGSIKLNINTATEEVLQTWYRTDISDAGELIVAERQGKPFKSEKEINGISGLETFGTGPTSNLVIKSDYYQIESIAFVNDGRRTIRANVKKNGDILYKRVL